MKNRRKQRVIKKVSANKEIIKNTKEKLALKLEKREKAKPTKHPIVVFMEYVEDHITPEERLYYNKEAKRANKSFKRTLAKNIYGFFRIKDDTFKLEEIE